METKKYGIVLRFDASTTEKAVSLSRKFLPMAGARPLELGSGTALPHLTLFMLMLDMAGLVAVINALSDLLDRKVVPKNGGPSFERGSKPLRGRFTQLRAMGTALYWAQPARENHVLLRLHQDIVRLCAPLRRGNVPPLGKQHGANLENWERYGYPLVMSRFHPHITLQWLSDDHAGTDFGDGAYVKRIWNWKSDSLGIIEMDDRGAISASDFVETFRLG